LCQSFHLQVPPPHSHVRLRLMLIQLVQQRMMRSQLAPHPRTRPRMCWTSPLHVLDVAPLPAHPRVASRAGTLPALPRAASASSTGGAHSPLPASLAPLRQHNRAVPRRASHRCPSSQPPLPGHPRSVPSQRSTRADPARLRHRPRTWHFGALSQCHPRTSAKGCCCCPSYGQPALDDHARV